MRAARRSFWKPILVAALAAVFVALLGGSITELGPWYQGLQKPAWQPPDWLFGPAWTLIFGLTAMAGVLAWRFSPSREGRSWTISLFALNALLNVLWSFLFFRLQRPDWALMEVGLLWLSVLVLMIVLWRTSKTASLLLAPYLAWVAFAALLNAEIVRLNTTF